jgi:two-component system LytT family response regulator/two-component system response regulator LytT
MRNRIGIAADDEFSVTGPKSTNLIDMASAQNGSMADLSAASIPLRALVIDDEQLAREELRYLLESVGNVQVLDEATNGIEALEKIERHQPDVIFLDVQMPGLDGFALIRHLMEHQETVPLPQIIFATAFDQYAVRAFDVNAVDYLLKPFDPLRIAQAIDRTRSRLAEQRGEDRANQDRANQDRANPDRSNPERPRAAEMSALLEMLERHRSSAQQKTSKLIVQVQSRLLLVDQAEICFASIDDGTICVVTPTIEGQSKCRTLEDLLELLDSQIFWRAHRGFVVNINHIREVVPWFKSSYQLRMNDRARTEIPVSRAQTRRLRELFRI